MRCVEEWEGKHDVNKVVGPLVRLRVSLVAGKNSLRTLTMLRGTVEELKISSVQIEKTGLKSGIILTTISKQRGPRTSCIVAFLTACWYLIPSALPSVFNQESPYL